MPRRFAAIVCAAVALLLLAVTPQPATTVLAQMQSRPAEAPLVTAENEAWYYQGEPVAFAGELYYRAGPTVFFNGNTMVRSGYFNGIALYSDTTVEPFSLVYVPLTRGQMQPYERPRRGDLAGTTGSRTPSFPVALGTDQRALPMAGLAPTSLVPTGDVVFSDGVTPGAGAVGTRGTVPRADDTSGRETRETTNPVVWVPSPPEVTLRRAESNDGIWLEYAGSRWLSAGRAVAWDETAFRRVGDYAGFPVYASQPGDDDTIYLPTRPGLVAPYKRKAS